MINHSQMIAIEIRYFELSLLEMKQARDRRDLLKLLIQGKCNFSSRERAVRIYLARDCDCNSIFCILSCLVLKVCHDRTSV